MLGPYRFIVSCLPIAFCQLSLINEYCIVLYSCIWIFRTHVPAHGFELFVGKMNSRVSCCASWTVSRVLRAGAIFSLAAFYVASLCQRSTCYYRCLSVCPSVRHTPILYRSGWTQSIPRGIPRTRIFWRQRSWWKSNVVAIKCTWVGKFATFGH